MNSNDIKTLIEAMEKNDEATIQHFLSKGENDWNLGDEDTRKLLHVATETRQIPVLKKIFAMGANVNQAALLRRATTFGRLQTVKTLLAAGADPNPSTNDEMSPLYWAVVTDEVAIAIELLAAGANTDLGPKSDTTLSFAITNG